MSTFKASISASKLVVNVEHDVRDRMWDVLGNHGDVIWKEGTTATQIEFRANAGFKSQDAISIVIAAYYLATKDNLDSVWTTSPSDNLKEAYILAKELGWELNPVWFELVLVSYIQKESRSAIRNIGAKSKNGGYNTGVVHDWWQKGIKAHQRLLGMNPTCSFITAEKWQGNLDAVTEKITQIKAEYDKICLLQKAISSVNSQIEKLLDTYDTTSRLAAIYADLPNLRELYNVTIAEFARLNAEAQTHKTFDDQVVTNLLNEIALLVPADTSK